MNRRSLPLSTPYSMNTRWHAWGGVAEWCVHLRGEPIRRGQQRGRDYRMWGAKEEGRGHMR